jgi:phosphate transport system permease protein
MATPPNNQDSPKPAFSKRRALFLGQDSDSLIKKFFGSNAMVAILVLALITIFLFKEGAGFVGLYHKSLVDYRQSGLEYVDILKEKREGYVELTRYMNDVRAQWINELKASGLSQEAIGQKISSEEAKAFFFGYTRAGSGIRQFVKTKMDSAVASRDQNATNQNLQDTLDNYATRIEEVKNPDYRLDEDSRASFSLRLLQYSRSNSLTAEEAVRFRDRAQAIESGASLEVSDRQILVRVLEQEYADTQARIEPIDFAVTVQEVVSDL